MKLVETDTEGPEKQPPAAMPPRPEHRRVAVSALLTVFVLAATVITIYIVFPRRDNQLMTRAFDFHRSEVEYDLQKPTRSQLVIFALGILGRVPWPDDDVRIVGVIATSILDYPAVMVRYDVNGRRVSLVVQRARDAPPRRLHRNKGDQRCESWRVSKWTFVAVGPMEDSSDWHKALKVP